MIHNLAGYAVNVSRLMTRAVRLLKFGAVAGAAVGVGRLVIRRRRRAEDAESSWPTIAETAAQHGESIDEEADTDSPELSQNGSADGGENSDGALSEADDRA